MIATAATHAAAAGARARDATCLEPLVSCFFSVILFYYTNVYISRIETLMAATTATLAAGAATAAAASSSGLTLMFILG